MRTLALALALLLAPAPAAAAETTGTGDAGTLEFPRLRRVPNATHDLRLYAYAFRGARWNTEEIVSAVAEAAGVLAQCNVAVTRVEVRLIEAPQRFHFYSTPVSRELLRNVTIAKPALFFVEDTKNDPAFDAEAIGLTNAKSRPELANTVWIAYGARDLSHALAHELVHVLSDSGDHTDEPGNLMRAETSASNNKLTAAQCDLMRSRGETNGLLKRLPF